MEGVQHRWLSTLPRKAPPRWARFYVLGLEDMPFPSNGFVNPYSDNPRINGKIYATLTAKSAIDGFKRLLIRPDDFLARASSPTSGLRATVRPVAG